jgi:hypothetical protein
MGVHLGLKVDQISEQNLQNSTSLWFLSDPILEINVASNICVLMKYVLVYQVYLVHLGYDPSSMCSMC